jgi:hypothetical protein
MKTLPKLDISDELAAHINEGSKLSELCKADVVRQALRIGLPQFASHQGVESTPFISPP